MKHLNKISISNARRFGSTEIDFGKGATIILAPNGTGKTTVFEAIEFALTGAVQRLGRPPLSLIRDNESGVDIRLDFEDNLFCEVNYRKGTEPKLSGDHNLIFPNRTIEEIPYLIRLTHLLEQRGTNWLVQQSNSNKAGDLLDKLSIGKELNRVYSTKTSATRAANIFQGNANKYLLESKEKLESFQKLLENRKSAIVDFTLRSLNDLNKEVIQIYLLFNETKPIIEDKLSTIISFTAQTISKLNSKIEDISNLSIQLAGFEGYIPEYILNKKAELVSKSLLTNIKTKIQSLNTEIEKNKVLQTKRIGENNAVTLDLKSIIELRDCFTEIEAGKTQFIVVEKEITEYNRNIENTQDKLTKNVKQLEQTKTINDKNKSLSDKEVELKKVKGELKSKEILTFEWQKLFDKIVSFTSSIIPNSIIKKEEQLAILSRKKIEIEKLVVEFDKTKKNVNSLKGVSDNIGGAVSIIANNLSKDRGDCPVCGAKYLPSELQSRISNAMSYINPLVTDAINNNIEANDKLNTAKVELNNIIEIFLITTKEIDSAVQQKKEAEAIINENILPYFSSFKLPKDANEWCKNELSRIDKEILDINNEQKEIVNILGLEESDKLHLDKKKLEREIEQLNVGVQGRKVKLASLKEDLIALKKKTGSTSIDEIRKNIIDYENLITNNVEEIEKLKQLKVTFQNLLDEKEKHITSENAKITQLTSRQNEIIAKWIEVEFSGEPNIDVLNEKKEVLSKKKTNLNNGKVNLKKVEEELAKWDKAEIYEKHNSVIKTFCGELNESEYIKKLKNDTKLAQVEFHKIEEKSSVLKNLYSKVSTELNLTNGYLEGIKPLWNSLLNRVVINPRFADTTLKSYTYRNKQQAEVNVKMHGKATNVIEIASEAQITDLQLTFILSMANTYQWTPWRALLLDDPTQHHDLVHAASVFDLLRDYIIEQDFQILFGTHDTVHANFFKRKLDNDGIPAKIWNLKSDNNGVKAVCIE